FPQLFSSSPHQNFLSIPPNMEAPPAEDTHGFSLSDSSATLLIAIIVLSGIFFVSSLFHLVVRFLLCARIRNSDQIEDDLTALQGRLHQLFDLHDSGVNQSFIDALPVFDYEAILGIEEAPFDCAVCLCEFGGEDKLRLLPKCSHAFHVDCIDTWLLSHSSCPLCRASLGDDSSLNRSCCVMVLESRNGSSRFQNSGDDGSPPAQGINETRRSGTMCSNRIITPGEIESEAGGCDKTLLNSAERFVQVKLGKYKAIDSSGSGVAESGAEARRCFSMGSFAYIIEGERARVPISLTRKRGSSSLRIPMHR
ncbi:hypothetical protein M569_03597, partial [Genlisea aurea]